MNRRSFLKGVFGAAALAVMPKLVPKPEGSAFLGTVRLKDDFTPEQIERFKTEWRRTAKMQWMQMMYGMPILYFPRKRMHLINIQSNRTSQHG